MKKVVKILIGVVVVFGLMQLIPIDRTNKPVKTNENFVDIYKTPTEVREILKTSCYDCHSNEVVYPSYSNIAPISWVIKDHINEGRSRLNFSEWGTYNDYLKENGIERCVQTLESYLMPLPSYISYHPEANLSKQQRELLINYFNSLKPKAEN